MRAALARWRGRAGGGALLAAAGYAIAVWFDFEPRLLPYAVWAVVLLALTYLVVDTVDVDPAHWQQAVRPRSDRVDEATSDLRVLTSHQQADEPSEALADRLVELADGRDPDLAAQVRRELSGVHRIAPADIDRILTRIEEARDRR
ncbi:hypothetical protein GCM10011376_14480 [Nocardioides flavus (ex Wang et al. 2016)]|uniref:Uncharacterized protein n=1 Tax=Nocardioides flavus (ex Wang et al. 2016) TaxID=2058780 RepID=A0ABQ3HGS4_9ACTN|nr:hypothetical protein [Nocardioides flavus (ex Wang et al. 2016)]GHE16838.1 hypothetical protein GCM10011376_14480 [Nocardioides flavus (ex Wang et al. 2016)]